MSSDYGGFDDFDEIEDETTPKPNPNSPGKKIEPPPKPMAPPPPQPKQIDEGVNKAAKTVKSIRQLKEELGPLTEEVKIDVEKAMQEIRHIVKVKRRLMLEFFFDKVVLV